MWSWTQPATDPAKAKAFLFLFFSIIAKKYMGNSETKPDHPSNGFLKSKLFRVDYLFANRRTNRLKVQVHDGFGIWLVADQTSSTKFIMHPAHHDLKPFGMPHKHKVITPNMIWMCRSPAHALNIVDTLASRLWD